MTRRASPARRRRTRRRYLTVALFMSPWIIGFLAFTVYPMLSSLYFSFTSYDLLSTPRWIGTANYPFMFTKDPLFWTAVKNTAFIIILGLPLRLVVAIATATLLVRPSRAIKSYRTAVFIPTLAPAVAGALAFLYLFNPSSGPVNQLLSGMGLGPAAVALRRAVGEADAGPAGDLGRRRRDDHLPGRDAQRPSRALRGRRHRGRERPATVLVRHAPVDLAGRSSSRS